ncbi:MAG: hypothetical protein AAFQ37_04250 [Bacteroidota bacterium]
MKIEREPGGRHFTLRKSNFKLAELRYPKWFNFDAQGSIGTVPVLLKKTSFWQSEYGIMVGSQPRGIIESRGWKGGFAIVVDWQFNGQTTTYLFRQRGFSNPRYELTTDLDEQLLITLRSKINWRRLVQEYSHEFNCPLPEATSLELLLYSIHCMRLYQARQAAAAS